MADFSQNIPLVFDKKMSHESYQTNRDHYGNYLTSVTERSDYISVDCGRDDSREL